MNLDCRREYMAQHKKWLIEIKQLRYFLVGKEGKKKILIIVEEIKWETIKNYPQDGFRSTPWFFWLSLWWEIA